MGMPAGSMPLPSPQTREFGERIMLLEEECRTELEQCSQAQQEIVGLLSKTNSEIEKIASRELQFSNRLRDMEMHLDNYSREDIRDLSSNAHEVQMRLFMMRSQAEQLQNRQQHLKEYQQKLRLVIDLLAVVPINDIEGGLPAPTRTAALGGMTTAFGTQTVEHGQHNAGASILSLIEAQEDERLRISRQIHDGPTQTLSNLILRAEICERLIDRDVAEAQTELRGLKSMINAALQDTRRLIFDLRPMILDDLGLVPTVRRYLAELSRLKGGLHADVEGPEHDLQLATTMQVVLFRFIQSIVGAFLSDGGAEHLVIEIEREPTAVRVLIEASGLEDDRTEIEGRLQEPHFQQRLTLLGGSLSTAPRPQRGLAAELLVTIPDGGAL